jgi:tyrosinase
MRLVMRQNQNTLSDDDKLAFASAVRALKDSDYGYYDELFVKVHRDTVDAATGREDAHKGPAFFPWHREFVRRFEAYLQWAARNPLLGLPYWDWSVDNSPNSSIWGSAGFLGGNGTTNDGQVTLGPFAFKNGWTLKYTIPSEEPTNYLRACYELGRKSHRNADSTGRLVPSRSTFPAFLSRF